MDKWNVLKVSLEETISKAKLLNDLTPTEHTEIYVLGFVLDKMNMIERVEEVTNLAEEKGRTNQSNQNES